MKTLGTLFVYLFLFASMAFGSDNLVLSKYTNISDVPETFLKITDAQNMATKSYLDDDGNLRTDKIYYTISDNYLSTLKVSDLLKMLDPASGKLGSLFEETTVNKASLVGTFNVMMVISTPLKDFDCESILKVKRFKEGAKDVFIYTFTDFNMVFTNMAIRVEVEQRGAYTSIAMKQIAALKGSTHTKLKNYFAVGKFEKAIKGNLQKFKDGVSGI